MSALRAGYYALFTAVYDAMRVLALWGKDRPSVAWRALIVFAVLQGVVLGSVKTWVEMLGLDHIEVTRSMSLALYLALLGLNYLALLRHGRWEAYLERFRGYPGRRQKRIKWAARVAVVLLVVASACTFHRFWHWATSHHQS